MKHLLKSKLYTALVIVIGLSSLTQAQLIKKEPKPVLYKNNHQVLCYIEMIEISTLDYALMMSSNSNSNDHTTMRNSLLKKIKAGKAKLIDNQVFSVQPSYHLRSENSIDYPHPTEYNPANFLFQKKTNPAEKAQPDSSGTIIPPMPTTFINHALGSTYDLEASLDKDKKDIIQLTLEVKLSKLIGENSWGTWTTPVTTIKIVQPMIYTVSMKQNVELNHGKFLMISTHSPTLKGKINTAKKVLVFVKATILK